MRFGKKKDSVKKGKQETPHAAGKGGAVKVPSSFTAFGDEVRMLMAEHAATESAEDWPIVKIVDDLLVLAHGHGTSDIHIEPYEERTLIRFRIDGILHDVAEVPRALHDLLTTRVKILSRLRTDEHAAAQDGKLRFPVNGDKVDVRVSIVPVIHGEKTVLRILSESERVIALDTIGFAPHDLAIIQRNIQRPWGMILATGPTGSGKTSTLYAALKVLNSTDVNISTIEDPVEYEMERVNQIQVNPRTELTFAKGLRSIVRQDPDIIMVGEIRDEETAKIAVNSAMTGHLVLSTLHTNDAATTLPRLADMGVPPFLIASTVSVVIAQRLVRRVCEQCTEQRAVDAGVLAVAREQLSPAMLKTYGFGAASATATYGRGCGECQDSGYRGRTMIAEVMEMTDPIRAMIMSRENASAIAAKAVKLGMTTIAEDGLRKVQAGVTTLEELLRVAQE
ncbi:MAG: GspE/PulE family protein [bacterium]|nr:GspE/PulE family protein [bacterium]